MEKFKSRPILYRATMDVNHSCFALFFWGFIVFFLSFSTTDEDQQPSLFELADIEESNEALMMPPPPSGGGASMPSLETPLISVDDTLDLNPLVAQITSKKGRKKMS